jgi:hypothetical protein
MSFGGKNIKMGIEIGRECERKRKKRKEKEKMRRAKVK